MPAGFQLAVFATVVGARGMAQAPDGTVFIGTGGFSDVDPDGRVTAIKDINGDHVIDPASEKWVIARDLDNPNGVAFMDGDLYVAERFQISKYPDILNHLSDPPDPKVITRDLPDSDNHSWKYLAAGPDGHLYVPVGSPCNICDPEVGSTAGKFSRIFRLKLNASRTAVQTKDVVASGVRNTVGFDWHPTTGEIWFTDNGRDEIDRQLTSQQRQKIVADMGIVIPRGEILNNLIPPDELNRVTQPGQDFGFPHCHGKVIHDPQFAGSINCNTSTAFRRPEFELQSHAAALGMKFYTGSMFPPEYKNQIFIAEHGSWNSTAAFPKGYKISLVTVDPAGQAATKYVPFISGFAYKDGADMVEWGRPVDVIVAPDGALLISDDHAGVVYRLTYTAP
jgi:glucose/arabinose dehydrogenase